MDSPYTISVATSRGAIVTCGHQTRSFVITLLQQLAGARLNLKTPVRLFTTKCFGSTRCGARHVASTLLAISALLSFGCSQQPARISPPEIDPHAAGALAIEMFDSDHNGILDAELDQCPGLKAAASIIDPSQQGITAAAISARIQQWQATQLGRIQIVCMVLRNGRPLEGAEVKFVPEPFLGENIESAIGITDQDGTAMPSIVDAQPPGIAPGLYRVEITKQGLNIPARYNSDTTLGQEIAQDATGMLGMRFNLQF